MRISDWSSDVCSSDLTQARSKGACPKMFDLKLGLAHFDLACVSQGSDLPLLGCNGLGPGIFERTYRSDGQARRTEEHTSELKSLLRTSYSASCLEKNKTEQCSHTTPNLAPTSSHRHLTV